MSKAMMSRQKQLWWLIGLSAATAGAQYVVQGAMASGGAPAQFDAWFWYGDYGLWGARALIEAWVIVYLFQTQARSRGQSVTLALFEVALIGLITLTLGPALRSLGYGALMRVTLAEPWFTLWNFGIAAYTSLMMGAAGYAYKVQSDGGPDATEVARLQQELSSERRRVASLETELAAALGDVSRAETEVALSRAWASMSGALKAQLVASACNNGDRPDVSELAAALGVSETTVRRGYLKADAR